MELPAFTSFDAISKVSLFPVSSKQVLYRNTVRCRNIGFLWCRNSKSFAGITMSSDEYSFSNDSGLRHSLGTKSGVIDVISIGCRKDAVLDFCLKSPFQLSSLRFWNTVMKESQEVQLQLRSYEEDSLPRIVKAPLFIKSCSTAIILVASAGYGSDHSVVVDIFKTIKSSNGLTVAIILKPFVFEGLRRRDEVKNLVEKLKENTDLLIEIDTDSLLKKDLVTLDEAMKTANDAVLLAINVISVLKSDMHRKLVDGLRSGIKEISILEINEIFARYKEARIGFGAAYNMKTSILRSLLDCPFLGVSLKDSNGMVICNLTSSVPINENDTAAFLHTFRQTTEYTKDIIVFTNHEPNLEPNLLITTVLALGSINVQQSSLSGGMLSRLARHFPLFSFWGKHQQQPADTRKENESENDKFNKDFESSEPLVSNKTTKSNALRCSEQNRGEQFDTSSDFSSLYDEIIRGDLACQREKLINWNLGPGYEVAQEWAKERAADGTSSMADNVNIFNLPVGVRSSEQLKDCSEASMAQEPVTENDVNVPNKSMSWSALTDAGLEAVLDFASTLLNGKYANKSNKQGVLSVRAASMLEAERDSSKKWIPIVEMQYRGGQYKGRCQGGLPEGKGRLVLGDGSIYDGTWRYGKRSGPGTFYFINGDVFQGSWRDDLMHGKGWFYFHTGDRWFANFWKGKANGESRFYTKNGDAFFGSFEDGWRHGQFLCINAKGRRYIEVWEYGVILESRHLDKDDGEE
ncbi:protein ACCUMULATION AND REPLICATION OF CHLOROPLASTS 3, chloroplastic isoform X3 [Prosopis cineraria]|uniref:protein ACCUMULATION AND REPLICATION OF CHLOROPLASTS 3, chloroplastic isoform X3 n=1 Tax=Prosopis cineraria TaxID=364024 RepID=UPI00240FB2EA|nr:protein ACCUMULATION AND REPLICATION OF CHLOROPLASTS 3, chloroplastic isoform X3 [Prosopis cineraria]